MGVIKGDTRSLDNGSYDSFPKLGVPLWGSYNEDNSILGV